MLAHTMVTMVMFHFCCDISTEVLKNSSFSGCFPLLLCVFVLKVVPEQAV